jgi:ABC-type antimicrobial peptide transport system permease subunit
LGAQAADVARRVTVESFTMLGLGCALGLAGGFACSTLVESLLFEVKPRDPQLLLIAGLVLALTAIAAAIPPVIRAVRIDPSLLLRSE